MSSLSGKVVVITGASSGLGREAALQFAQRGARVVLAARRDEALAETEQMCRANGGEALSVVTDVTDEKQVKDLVARTLKRFSRIDVWVNNAGVTLFAPLDKASFDEHRRVIETNLYGAMHCARALIPVFRKQRRGVLINVGSILSKIGQPFVPSYVISKFALRGLSEALRSQFADDPDIHVCSLFPYTIDTPHFQSGANHVGADALAMPPIQPPEKVAAALVDLAEHPRRELHVPKVAVLGLVLHELMPRTVERLVLRALRKWHFGEEEEPRNTGNLYEPDPEKAEVHGERTPQVSTPALAAWAARQFVRIEAQVAERMVHKWSERAKKWPASTRDDPLTRSIHIVP